MMNRLTRTRQAWPAVALIVGAVIGFPLALAVAVGWAVVNAAAWIVRRRRAHPCPACQHRCHQIAEAEQKLAALRRMVHHRFDVSAYSAAAHEAHAAVTKLAFPGGEAITPRRVETRRRSSSRAKGAS